MFGNDPLKLHDRWTLSADGATLTLREVSQNKDDPERTSVFVMRRRGEADWPPDRSTEPAETQYRNIQVLKGLPASQLPGVMRSFARGLGVQCSEARGAPDARAHRALELRGPSAARRRELLDVPPRRAHAREVIPRYPAWR